jgi:hypothetical protein
MAARLIRSDLDFDNPVNSGGPGIYLQKYRQEEVIEGLENTG